MTTDPNQPHDPNQPSDPSQPHNPNTPPSSQPSAVGPDDPYAAPPAPGTSAPPPAGAAPGYGTQPPPPSGGYSPPPAERSTGSTGFDRSKLSTYDLGLGAAPVLFLLALLLPWVSVSVDGGTGIGTFSESQNGFGSGLLTFAWILLIAAAVLALLPATSAKVTLPFPVGLALLGLTGLAALLTLIALIDVLGAGDELGGLGSGVDVGTGIGAWLGILVALGALALAFLSFQASRRTHTT